MSFELSAISRVASIATGLQADVLTLEKPTGQVATSFKEGKTNQEEMCFWYKTLVRAFLSFAEGLCFSMRHTAALYSGVAGVEFPPEVMSSIANTSPKLPLYRSFRVAFRHFPRLFGIKYDLQLGDADYRAFAKLVATRGRFSHPKTILDLCPVAIFPCLHPAFEWFVLQWAEVLTACGHAAVGNVVRSPTFERKYQTTDKKLSAADRREDGWEEELRSLSPETALRELLEGLRADTKRAMVLQVTPAGGDLSLPRGCAQRALLRTLMSEIEGAVYGAADYLFTTGRNETRPSEDLLRGTHEEIRTRAIDTIEEYSRCVGTKARIERSGPGWDSFLPVRAARHRVEHPPDAAVLQLTEHELDLTLILMRWWYSEVVPLLGI